VNIQLKRFTTNARLSQETTAFAADVWVDGKKVGHAENDGHGGATRVQLDPSVRAKVEAHGKTLVPAEYARFTGGAEWIVDQLVEAELIKREDARVAKILAKNDAAEKARFAKHGFRTARLRSGDAWTWFAFKANENPTTVASTVAAKHQASVDELVVLP
jgi:hypothetical protein